MFCLTSLDTATRLARYMFQELFTPQGVEIKDLTGWRRVVTNPWFATIVTVVLGVWLGMTGYQLVWPLFGAANPAFSLPWACSPCAHGSAMRDANNKMFYVPMAFMLIVTLTSLVMTLYAKCMALAGGAFDAATILQLLIALLLIILAVILAVKGLRTIFGAHKGGSGTSGGDSANADAKANPADEPLRAC